MKIKDVIKNFRDLKDEVLAVREGMDYSKALRIADFCDRAIYEFGQDEAYYGAGEEVFSISRPLTLADIDSAQKQSYLMDNRKKAYTPRSGDEDDIQPITEKEDLARAKQIISDIARVDWPSDLFTPLEINSLSMKDELEILDVVDAAGTKDFIQNQKLDQMEQNDSIERILETYMEAPPWESKIYDSRFNAWLLKDCQAIEDFCSINTKYLREERESLERIVNDLKEGDIPISMRDIVKIFSYGCSVKAYFNQEMDRRHSLQMLMKGDCGLIVRPIVAFLQKAGMKDKDIVDTFSGMKNFAKSLFGSRKQFIDSKA